MVSKVFLASLPRAWDVDVEDKIEIRPKLTAIREPYRKVKLRLRKIEKIDA